MQGVVIEVHMVHMLGAHQAYTALPRRLFDTELAKSSLLCSLRPALQGSDGESL